MLTEVNRIGGELRKINFIDAFKCIFDGISIDSMVNQAYRLPPERKLENDIFSRAEINYQIRRLRDSGLIDSRRGDGNYLISDTQKASTRSIKTLLEQLIYLGYLTSFEINKTRMTIELLIFEYWIFMSYEEQSIIISELQLKVNQMEFFFNKYNSVITDNEKENLIDKIIEVDIDFHKIIGNIANTTLLSIFVNAISELQKDEIKKFWLLSSYNKKRLLIDDHIQILESLEKLARLTKENNDIFNISNTLDKIKIIQGSNENEIEILKKFENAKNEYQIAVTSHYIDSKMVD